MKHIATNTMHSAAMLSGFFSFGGAAAALAVEVAKVGEKGGSTRAGFG
jgi:hypothetical protein